MELGKTRHAARFGGARSRASPSISMSISADRGVPADLAMGSIIGRLFRELRLPCRWR